MHFPKVMQMQSYPMVPAMMIDKQCLQESNNHPCTGADFHLQLYDLDLHEKHR